MILIVIVLSVVRVLPSRHTIPRRQYITVVVDDIATIVEQVYGDLRRHPHDPIEVVRVPRCPVPNCVPHGENGA